MRPPLSSFQIMPRATGTDLSRCGSGKIEKLGVEDSTYGGIEPPPHSCLCTGFAQRVHRPNKGSFSVNYNELLRSRMVDTPGLEVIRWVRLAANKRVEVRLVSCHRNTSIQVTYLSRKSNVFEIPNGKGLLGCRTGVISRAQVKNQLQPTCGNT